MLVPGEPFFGLPVAEGLAKGGDGRTANAGVIISHYWAKGDL